MKSFYQKHRIVILLLCGGLLTGLPLVLPRLGFLQWIATVPAALVLYESAEDGTVRLRGLYRRGLLFFWAYYAVSFHWFFYMYPLDFAGLSPIAAAAVVCVACFGLSLLQAVFSAFVFVIAGAILRCEHIKRYPMASPFVCSAAWVVAEWFQTVGWWGVPWGRLPLGQLESTLLLRSASLLGSYFITFVMVLVNFCVARFLLYRDLRKPLLSIALSAFCLNLALGSLVTLCYREEGEKVTVAAAQGNISSSEKWKMDNLYFTRGIYDGLTVAAASNGAELVVWPETALPYVFFETEELVDYVSDLARENGVTILVPTLLRDEESGLLKNSVLEVGPDGSFGEISYDKQRLVPFGEFVPMRRLCSMLFPPLTELGMLAEDLEAGKESVVLSTEVGRVGCAICFDSIYENEVRESVLGGAQVITVSTNDSWFRDSAALYMHQGQSVLRAIENGRYVVRSANTGISSVIDPMGNVIDSLGANRRGYVISDVCLREEITLYTRIGNLFVYLCAAFLIGEGGTILLSKRKNKVNIKFVTK